MTFQLDTTGTVRFRGFDRAPGFEDRDHIWWSDLDAFTQGYIEALFTASEADLFAQAFNRPQRYTPAAFRFSDLAPETLARIIADCEAWRSEYGTVCRVEPPASKNTGRCFWDVRQSGKSATFPPLTVQLGDDGKVRFG